MLEESRAHRQVKVDPNAASPYSNARLPHMAAWGRSHCASNSGTGDEIPQRPVVCFHRRPSAECRHPSPNWTTDHFRHRPAGFHERFTQIVNYLLAGLAAALPTRPKAARDNAAARQRRAATENRDSHAPGGAQPVLLRQRGQHRL
jgi:hypothetical protein